MVLDQNIPWRQWMRFMHKCFYSAESGGRGGQEKGRTTPHFISLAAIPALGFFF